MEIAPPYRIETERTVIRCWQPEDSALLGEAITESLDDLKRWMPWAHEEPKSLDQRIDLLRTFRGQFDKGEDFIYGIFSSDEATVIGGTGLHPRLGESALEIGYWVRSSAAGQGLATEAAAAVTVAAFRHCQPTRLEIHADASNEPSIRVAEKLGFTREACLRRRLPPLVPGGPQGDLVVFSMFAEDFGTSMPAKATINAFDAAQRPLT